MKQVNGLADTTRPATNRVLLWCTLILTVSPGAELVHAYNMRGYRRLDQPFSVSSNSTRFRRPYNVCTSDWAPMVTCADISDPADYTGYQIALWREIAADLGWSDDDWTFTCMDWTAMIDDLLDSNGSCSFAAAGVEVSLANILSGLKFSWPIFKSGFRVLVSSEVQQGGTWAFAAVFEWTVWVLIGGTAIAIGFLITAVELSTIGSMANRKGLRGWSWYAMAKILQIPVHVGDPKTWASRIMVLGYAFLALILVHLYTATTASRLTMQRLANDITGKADLPGKKVESWEPYVPLLRKYSIDADALPWDNDDDTRTMLNNLRTHTYQALVLDAPVVSYLAAQAEHCDLYPVGELFESFDLAIAFPPDAPVDLAANISTSLVRLQTTGGLLDRLENVFVKSQVDPLGKFSAPAGTQDACAILDADSSSHGHAADPQIRLKQVLGLWYILAITAGLAAVHTVMVLIAYNRKMRQRLTAVARSLTGGGSPAVAPDPASGPGDGSLNTATCPSQGVIDSVQPYGNSVEDCVTTIAIVEGPGSKTHPPTTKAGHQPGHVPVLGTKQRPCPVPRLRHEPAELHLAPSLQSFLLGKGASGSGQQVRTNNSQTGPSGQVTARGVLVLTDADADSEGEHS